METVKYTKNQLVEAFETYRKSTEIFNDICRSIKPVVVDAVNACVEMAGNIRFTLDETVRRLRQSDMAGDHHWGRLHRLRRQCRTITDAHEKYY